jgi:hypothetical protein
LSRIPPQAAPRELDKIAAHIQSLQLTELKAWVLEAITDEKIESASLVQLGTAFGILKKGDVGPANEPFKMKGLLWYLLELKKAEQDR